MPVKRCTLNGRNIFSMDQVYDQLADRFKLPAHFGRNLDALWDVLSTDLEGPFEIVWTHAGESKKALGRNYTRIMKLFLRLEKQRDDFRFKLE